MLKVIGYEDTKNKPGYRTYNIPQIIQYSLFHIPIN